MGVHSQAFPSSLSHTHISACSHLLDSLLPARPRAAAVARSSSRPRSPPNYPALTLTHTFLPLHRLLTSWPRAAAVARSSSRPRSPPNYPALSLSHTHSCLFTGYCPRGPGQQQLHGPHPDRGHHPTTLLSLSHTHSCLFTGYCPRGPGQQQLHGADQTEVTSEETAVDAKVTRALQPIGGRVEKLWGSTLFHWEEVAGPQGAMGPQGIRGMPDVFTPFKEKVRCLQRGLPSEGPAIRGARGEGEGRGGEGCGARCCSTGRRVACGD